MIWMGYANSRQHGRPRGQPERKHQKIGSTIFFEEIGNKAVLTTVSVGLAFHVREAKAERGNILLRIDLEPLSGDVVNGVHGGTLLEIGLVRDTGFEPVTPTVSR
jgi:hypothetical protein